MKAWSLEGTFSEDMDVSKLTSLYSSVNFSRQLEGYLHADNPGKKTIFREVPSALREKEAQIRENFAGGDPKIISKYSGYYSAFGYNDRARFVNGVANMLNTVSSVLGKNVIG